MRDNTGAVELRLSPGTGGAESEATIRLTGQSYSTSEGFVINYVNGVGDTYFDNVWASGVDSNPAIRFRTKTAGTAVNALTITHGGNVGIGTTNPGQKLSVNGVIQFGSFGVASSGSTGSIANGATVDLPANNGLHIITGRGAGWEGLAPIGVCTTTNDGANGYVYTLQSAGMTFAIVYGNILRVTNTSGVALTFYWQYIGT